MNPVKPGNRAQTPTFDPKSSTYHNDLHKAGFISDAQLAAANSGNRTDAEAADAQVLSIHTFTAERPLTQKQSSVIHPVAPVSSAELHAKQRVRDALLKEKFIKDGCKFIDNKVENHNCLITSILQHATENYTENHPVIAAEYREKLNAHLQRDLTPEQKKKFPKNDLLDGDHTHWLLKEMAKDSRIKRKDLAIELWVADDKGDPVGFSFGEGKTKAIIFNSTDHFEAVILPPVSANTANSATTTSTSKPGSTKEPTQNADKGLEFFYDTPDPLKQDIDN